MRGEVKECNEEEGQIKMRLENSQSRIEALDEEILKATIESRMKMGANNKSWHWSINKHPELDTEEESNSYGDGKFEKILERELSISDSDK